MTLSEYRHPDGDTLAPFSATAGETPSPAPSLGMVEIAVGQAGRLCGDARSCLLSFGLRAQRVPNEA
jgi:hypothetical protein